MLTQNYKIINPLPEETKTVKRQHKKRAERTVGLSIFLTWKPNWEFELGTDKNLSPRLSGSLCYVQHGLQRFSSIFSSLNKRPWIWGHDNTGGRSGKMESDSKNQCSLLWEWGPVLLIQTALAQRGLKFQYKTFPIDSWIWALCPWEGLEFGERGASCTSSLLQDQRPAWLSLNHSLFVGPLKQVLNALQPYLLRHDGLYPLKPWSKINSSFFKFLVNKYLFTAMRKVTTTGGFHGNETNCKTDELIWLDWHFHFHLKDITLWKTYLESFSSSRAVNVNLGQSLRKQN